MIRIEKVSNRNVLEISESKSIGTGYGDGNSSIMDNPLFRKFYPEYFPNQTDEEREWLYLNEVSKEFPLGRKNIVVR